MNAKRVRERMRSSEARVIRTVTLAGGGYGMGRLDDLVDRLSIRGVPGEATIAAASLGLGLLLGRRAGGMLPVALEGIGDAGLAIAAAKMGHQAAAASPATSGAAEDELPALERELHRLEEKTAGAADDDLAWAAAAEAAGWAPPDGAAGAADDLAWAESAEAAGWVPPNCADGAGAGVVDADYEDFLDSD